MSFLDSIFEKLEKYGEDTTLSDSQRNWLNDIFAKTDVHRDHRKRP